MLHHAAVYATPLVTDLYGDGRKEIVVPTFVRYVEALDAAEGQHAEGAWPASFGGTSHAGAVLWDADADGVRDVVVTTYDAELLFFRDDGSRIQRKLSVPKLRVRKKRPLAAAVYSAV